MKSKSINQGRGPSPAMRSIVTKKAQTRVAWRRRSFAIHEELGSGSSVIVGRSEIGAWTALIS